MERDNPAICGGVKMNKIFLCILATVVAFAVTVNANGGLQSSAIRETAELVFKKFGKGVAGETVDQIAETTARIVTKYGDDSLPFLRKAGQPGYRALTEAGDKAPELIKLYARKGDEAIWIISEPKKLAIFIKHGDNAADALLKHPKIAENLIGKYSEDAVGALNSISKNNGQRLGIMVGDGTLDKIGRQAEVLKVIRKYGDEAMDFVWKNKGALAVTTVLASFLNDPEVYIRGVKSLVVEPFVMPIVNSVNWTWIILTVCTVLLIPYVVRQLLRAARTQKTGSFTKGKAFNSMKCSKCGHVVYPTSNYCTNCGTLVAKQQQPIVDPLVKTKEH
jgi:hypothetical protein